MRGSYRPAATAAGAPAEAARGTHAAPYNSPVITAGRLPLPRALPLLVLCATLALPARRSTAEDPPAAPGKPAEPPKAEPAKPPEPGAAQAEELKAKKESLARRKAALPETAKPATALLEAFEKREFRLWTTMRREVVAMGAAAVPALVVGLDELDWEVRSFAASCLAQLKAVDAVEPLCALLRRETFAEGRRQVLLAIAALADPKGREALEEHVESKDVGLRLAATRGLGAIPGTADVLRKRVKDDDLDVRYEALGALAAAGDKDATDTLVAAAEKLVADREIARVVSFEQSDNGDRYEQYLLGLAVARAPDARAQKIAAAVVLAEKPWDKKDFLRVGAADGLGRRAAAGEALPKAVLGGLTHDQTEVRLACTRAVAGARSPDHVARLGRVLADSQLDVRHEAVVGLGRIPTPESVKALRKALADRADEVRLAAVRALAEIRTPDATAAIVDAARDDKYMIRTLAVRELGWRAGEPGVLPALLRAAKDLDYGVREQAMAALSHAPKPEDVVEMLVSGLAERDPGVRANACLALSRLPPTTAGVGDAGVVRRILTLHLTSPTPKLDKATKEYFDALRPPAAMDALIAALSDDTLEARKRAHTLLLRITETSQGYAPEAAKSERDAAIERWKTWWAAQGGKLPQRERRARLVTSVSESESLEATTKDYKWKGLDISLLLDSTGSMAGLIRASKERMDEIIAELSALLPSLRVSVYTYRDHGDDYLFWGSPLTFDTWKLSGFLQNAVHGQGGDLPEAVTETVLNATTALRWRPEAHKVVLYAGDAPHHPEQEGDLIAKVKRWFTVRNQAQLHALFTDTNRRSLDIKARKAREDTSSMRSPFFDKYKLVAEAGRGRAVLLDDESALIRELLVIAFGEPWRADIEMILDFER